MKKAIQFITVLTLTALLTSCNSAVAYPIAPTTTPEATPVATLAPTPAPTTTPVPPPEPTREQSGDHFEFAKRYCEQYGYEYTDDYAAAFLYALYTLPSDFSNINPEFPANLYQHPYNTWAAPTLKKDYAFKTNVECIAKYGIDEITAIMEAVKGFARSDLNQDYTAENLEEVYADFYYNALSYSEEVGYVEDILKVGKKNQITEIGVLITDPSLVYQCADGLFRVRGRALFNMSHASPKFVNENNFELNKWYWFDIEYNVILDEPMNNAKYEHGKYGVYNWLYISNGWTEADPNMIALAEAHMA